MADWPDHSWADAVDYIPLDERLPIEQTLRAVAPSLVIFSRGDLWPEFVHGAKRLDVPLVVIGGTKGRASKLHWLPKRSAARSVFTQLDWIGTNRTRDRERWRLAGAPESVIEITGDPRHDQIIERTMRLAAVHEVSQWTANKTLLVAGSTNAEDEQIVLQAFERIRFERQAVRVMIVPHERMPGHARRLFSRLRQSDVTHCKWSEGALDPDVQCVVVTRMGVLADLYAHADIAYVGGGFRKGGLHAVAEPAVYAVPVIVGPRYRDSTDAEEMVTANGAVALDSRAPVESLVRHWERFLDDVELRWKCGLNARKTMQEGAADRTVRALLRLLPDLGKPPSKTN